MCIRKRQLVPISATHSMVFGLKMSVWSCLGKTPIRRLVVQQGEPLKMGLGRANPKRWLVASKA